jgi:hypothetical protein
VKNLARLRHLSPRTKASYLYCIHEFEYRQLTIRDRKGAVDRVTMLPQTILELLTQQLHDAKLLHQQD